jgi:hypothetical protein
MIDESSVVAAAACAGRSLAGLSSRHLGQRTNVALSETRSATEQDWHRATMVPRVATDPSGTTPPICTSGSSVGSIKIGFRSSMEMLMGTFGGIKHLCRAAKLSSAAVRWGTSGRTKCGGR